MRIYFVLASVVALVIGRAQAVGAPAAEVAPGSVAGSVYGKAVTAGEIGLKTPIDVGVQFDARDKDRWEQMGRIAKAFAQPVIERFIKEQKIVATEKEIASFQANWRKRHLERLQKDQERLATIKKELGETGITEQERAKLEKQRATVERILAHSLRADADNVADEFARTIIVNWKVERELHRKFGGRVIFQQAGIEALDGRRSLYEKAEKDGALKLDDPGVRRMLYYYYTDMKHSEIPADGLERPWFFAAE